MTKSTWVVGATGLLGAAVTRRLATDGDSILSSATIHWSDTERSRADLLAGIRMWLDAPGATTFRLVWAAGSGVTASGQNALDVEEATFAEFARQLRGELAARSLGPTVAVFFASSAGGIYAGGSHPPYDESSEPHPLTAYGETKLAMESIVTRLASETGIRAVIGRISNLYGPGQRIEKQQGFVSQVCRSMLTRRPISVYVSLDTTRDYLFADDAAVVVEACLERLELSGVAGTSTIKNVASHVPTTLGRVLHEARLVFKRKPTVILASSALAAGQARDLRIGSRVWPEINDLPRRSLLVGLAETRANMELQLQANGDSIR